MRGRTIAILVATDFRKFQSLLDFTATANKKQQKSQNTQKQNKKQPQGFLHSPGRGCVLLKRDLYILKNPILSVHLHTPFLIAVAPKPSY
jgi:hypothetical protein